MLVAAMYISDSMHVPALTRRLPDAPGPKLLSANLIFNPRTPQVTYAPHTAQPHLRSLFSDLKCQLHTLQIPKATWAVYAENCIPASLALYLTPPHGKDAVLC